MENENKNELVTEIEFESLPVEESQEELPLDLDEYYGKREEDFALELDYLDPELQDEKIWQERSGLTRDSLSGAIETVIFMSERPVPLTKIRKLIHDSLPLRVIHECLLKLQDEYEQKHHGIRLLEVAEGYQFRTKAIYSKYVQEMLKVTSLVLSPTALEVLAIIAYKQPVAKSEIDKIRGVDSSHIVRALMDKRLVKIVGRGDDVGRPSLFGTTLEFLEVFNLPNLEALPAEHELQELASQNDIGAIGDIKTICNGDKTRFVFDEMEELEALADSIKSIPTDTPFITSLKVEEKKRIDENGVQVKTAFELLEEHLDMERVRLTNVKASESEIVSMAIDPKIIHDLEAGPFNLPHEQDEEDFEMIDLDTGLPVVDDEEEEISETTTDEFMLGNPFSDTDREELSRALDEAFLELTGEKIDEAKEMLSDSDFSEMEDAEDEVGQKIEDLVAMAQKEHDLDLNFLKDLGGQEESENDA